MTTKKMFYIMLSAVTGSVVGIVALIYFGNVILTKQSNKLIDTKAINLSLDKQETSLIKAKKDINKYQNLEEITQAIVPTDKDQARAAREIITIAQNNGFKLKTITFPASNLGSKPANSNTRNFRRPRHDFVDDTASDIDGRTSVGVTHYSGCCFSAFIVTGKQIGRAHV